jgi:hypothetical protein
MNVTAPCTYKYRHSWTCMSMLHTHTHKHTNAHTHTHTHTHTHIHIDDICMYIHVHARSWNHEHVWTCTYISVPCSDTYVWSMYSLPYPVQVDRIPDEWRWSIRDGEVRRLWLWRAEPGRAGTINMYSYWKVGLFIAMLHLAVGIQPALRLPFTREALRVSWTAEAALMVVPTRVTMDTSALPMCPCINESIGSIFLQRFCSC